MSLLIATMLAATTGVAIEKPEQLPRELLGFVDHDDHAIWLSSADLDRDGDEDHVLVLERQATDHVIEERQRPLLVILREADGSLRVAKRNERIVMCSTCGGVMGDPFVAVEAGPGTFTVRHYGGSSWRWGVDYRFNWSRRDRSWQLVEVSSTSFHSSEPEKTEDKRLVPPKDFGKIDLADFDPEDYEGKGER